MTINITLEGSRLRIADQQPILADGSVKTVKFRVAANADWDGLSITVIFRRVYAIGEDARSVVVGDVAASYDVPHEVLHDGYLYIGAIGVASNGEVRLTTAKLDQPLRVYASEDLAADASGSVTPSVADQILSIIGSVSNLDTDDKSSIVAAVNEIHGAIDGLSAKPALPIARGDSNDGIAYAATGDDLPVVSATSANHDNIGKGQQIVFIPYAKNADTAPTLQINGGEIIPIRQRAPQNQSSNDISPDATLPVPAGALMRGVPYTLTFCGKYWLVDSQIATVPAPTATDTGKVLTVSEAGAAVWTAVANAEEVAV